MIKTPFRRLRSGEVSFLMIDIQEKLFPNIENQEEINKNSQRLLAAARLLDVPFIYTEQYPKGIGHTYADLMKSLPENPVRFEKSAFSCMDEPGFSQLLDGTGKRSFAVWGIETHICVLTTVMDMLNEGYDVAVVADACGSRTSKNRDTALSSMSENGALIVSTETAVYQLLEKSGTPQFKAMLPFFK